MLNTNQPTQVPSITFNTINDQQWNQITTESLFAGQKVVVFSLPGAFTPTCSSSHLPRYDALAETFKAHGVDRIICISVNDTFVMNAWSADQGTQNIEFIPDGNGDFTEAMGMLVDKTDIGFGKRSWRYSMLVDDGKITKMFIEPDLPGDPFEVSDADTMLEFINPEAQKPKNISVITKPGCGFCTKAKDALRAKKLNFEEVEIGSNGLSSNSLQALSGMGTTPQIFVDGQLIGGSEALDEWLAAL